MCLFGQPGDDSPKPTECGKVLGGGGGGPEGAAASAPLSRHCLLSAS